MYNLKDIKTVHLEVTSRCQASCPMCVRNIHGGIENPWLVLNEISLDQFKEWFPAEFIQQLDKLYMCGNTGDPIVAKDTLRIFEYLRNINPTMQLSMNTNGSAQNVNFWQRLAILDVVVRFGIDGMYDTHSLYRIGTHWDKIIENAQTFIDEGGTAIWDMLIFDHNKHQVEQCRQLSINLGFAEFVTKNTSRFKDGVHHVLDKTGKTTHILHPSIKSKQIYNLLHTNEEPCVINCKVKTEKSIYVNAHGEVAPCCWLDFSGVPPLNLSLINYKDNNFKNPSLKNDSLLEIFNSRFFETIEASWDNPLRQCSRQCGTVDKFKEQFND